MKTVPLPSDGTLYNTRGNVATPRPAYLHKYQLQHNAEDRDCVEEEVGGCEGITATAGKEEGLDMNRY
jgi:hypothetical protein